MFRQAYAQVDSPDAVRPPDNEELRTYPLYPYLQAARIRRALVDVSGPPGPVDERALTFITYYGDEPVGRSLRSVWLASLAARQQWPTFLEHYRASAADAALQCQSFTARIELGRTTDLMQDIARRWLTPHSLPDCERAFEWLRSRNGLLPSLIEERARLALESNSPGFARQLAPELPPDRAAAVLQWADLIENPLRQIDALIAAPSRPVEDEALLAGWTLLARKDRDAAVQRYDALVRSRKLAPQTASRCALALAMALAWDHRREALEYFARVAPADLDDYALEWRTRAALWTENWKLVTESIAAMSDSQRAQARWRYWAARAAERGGDGKLAKQLYESVLADDNFYSILAAARLDRRLAPHPEKLVADPVQIERLATLPAFVRARELLLSDMRSAAGVEWAHGYGMLPPPARPQAVHLAVRWKWYEQAIGTAAQLRLYNDYKLLYPRPFDQHVRAGAKLSGLTPELIYSVMRQESLYRPDAMSTAGARGLLQLLPDTASRTARAWKRPRPAPDDLFQPAVSIALGAAQLRTLADRFNGHIVLALAGYNAGPRAVERWLPAWSVEPDVWIENVPYNETRNYVQRILWHHVVFNWLRSGQPQQAQRWLARISPPLEGAAPGNP